ncbi:uncharacterized protein TNCV_2757631 [Trichonephila clavipes]|nr:uncharacterized protein TNCV_2757631 [Trichonephila clavipes]
MIESNIIASGSVNGLVEGKYFNRCKRLHPLMALGLKMLHFDHFLDNIEYNFLKEQVIDDLLHYQEVIDSHSSMPIEFPNNVLSRVLSAYQKLVEETRQDCERLRHNETTSTVSIGPNQIRHHNFSGELKNTQFKEALVKLMPFKAARKSVEYQRAVRQPLRREAGVSPLLSIGWWYLSSVSPKRHCCRVNTADKGCRVYPLDPRLDAVVLYSGCTPGKRRAWYLPDDRHTASLVGLRGGWRHARTKMLTRTYGSNAAVPG